MFTLFFDCIYIIMFLVIYTVSIYGAGYIAIATFRYGRLESKWYGTLAACAIVAIMCSVQVYEWNIA